MYSPPQGDGWHLSLCLTFQLLSSVPTLEAKYNRRHCCLGPSFQTRECLLTQQQAGCHSGPLRAALTQTAQGLI